MIKRFFSILLILTMLTGLFAGCGKEETVEIDSDATVLTLALRDGIYADAIMESLPAFEEANGVHCEVLELSEDGLHSDVVDDAANADGIFDLCMVDGSWMAEYTSKGVLLDLTEQGYELDDDIIPATTEVCYHDGDVYLAPYYGNVTVLLYNKAILQREGYEPEDLDSLDAIYDVCYSSARRGNLGFMYRGDSANNYVVDFLPILLSYGGWVVDEAMQPTIDTPEFREALEFYIELIGTGTAVPRDDLVIAIANEAAAMGIGWPGWYTPRANSAADYSAITGKKSSDSVAYNANVYGVWTIGVPANSTEKELAVKLLEYLMDPEVQRSTIEIGGVPCRYSSLRDPDVLAEFPQYDVVCEALEGGVYRPIMEEWSDFYTILGGYMEQIIHNEINIDEGLAAAQRDIEAMLAEE